VQRLPVELGLKEPELLLQRVEPELLLLAEPGRQVHYWKNIQ
jgi:hypothetical protein